jgi:hypothetical protein
MLSLSVSRCWRPAPGTPMEITHTLDLLPVMGSSLTNTLAHHGTQHAPHQHVCCMLHMLQIPLVL